jgi:hypothetical protein
MVVWSANDAAQPERTSTTPECGQPAYLRHKRLDVLADARLWGFGHGVRRPRILFARTRVTGTS